VKLIAYNALRIFVFGRIRFHFVYFHVDFKPPCVARFYVSHLGKRILHKITAVFVKVVHAEIVRPGDRRSRGVAGKHVREEEYPFMPARFLRDKAEKSAFRGLDVIFVAAADVGDNVKPELRNVFALENKA